MIFQSIVCVDRADLAESAYNCSDFFVCYGILGLSVFALLLPPQNTHTLMCPRVSPALIRKAYAIDRCLPLLLPQCRNIEQATQELRWLKEELGCTKSTYDSSGGSSSIPNTALLRRACKLRSRGVPLQYILGSQPFGSLEILCKRNVLIPRWETEEWSLELSRCIRSYFTRQYNELSGSSSGGNSFRVVDLCTGTGCIALTILKETYQALSSAAILLDVTAIDCSTAAVKLTEQNYAHNFPSETADVGSTKGELKSKFNVLKLDILRSRFPVSPYSPVDILTANPPYIPKTEFVKEVRSSVRAYEPSLALLGDLEFYKDLVDRWIASGYINSFVYELGSLEQFKYVHKRVVEDPKLCDLWSIGVRYDSIGKPRCVYGFKKAISSGLNIDFAKLFDGFGQLA